MATRLRSTSCSSCWPLLPAPHLAVPPRPHQCSWQLSWGAEGDPQPSPSLLGGTELLGSSGQVRPCSGGHRPSAWGGKGTGDSTGTARWLRGREAKWKITRLLPCAPEQGCVRGARSQPGTRLRGWRSADLELGPRAPPARVMEQPPLPTVALGAAGDGEQAELGTSSCLGTRHRHGAYTWRRHGDPTDPTDGDPKRERTISSSPPSSGRTHAAHGTPPALSCPPPPRRTTYQGVRGRGAAVAIAPLAGLAGTAGAG